MNELPELKDQIKDYLMAEPSPFSHYNEGTKTFMDGANPVWKQLCMQKFDWIRRIIDQGIKNNVTPASLASYSDKKEIFGVNEPSLKNYMERLQYPDFVIHDLEKESVYEEYAATFNWRDLYHKICFEFMLHNFDKFLDFSVFYEYVNKLGDSLEVLRIRGINKTKLKSNHYWIMVLMTKLTKLRVVKLHGNESVNLGPDFFKFLLKGMNYMAKEGRQLEKLQINKMLGLNANPADNLFPCMKPH